MPTDGTPGHPTPTLWDWKSPCNTSSLQLEKKGLGDRETLRTVLQLLGDFPESWAVFLHSWDQEEGKKIVFFSPLLGDFLGWESDTAFGNQYPLTVLVLPWAKCCDLQEGHVVSQGGAETTSLTGIEKLKKQTWDWNDKITSLDSSSPFSLLLPHILLGFPVNHVFYPLQPRSPDITFSISDDLIAVSRANDNCLRIHNFLLESYSCPSISRKSNHVSEAA